MRRSGYVKSPNETYELVLPVRPLVWVSRNAKPDIPERQSDKVPMIDVDPNQLVMPSGFVALDDGDQYVLLNGHPMLLAEAHVELETRTVGLNETDEWSHVAIVALDEQYYVHGPVMEHVEFRARMVRGGASEWVDPISIDMRCDDLCGNDGGNLGFGGEAGEGGDPGFGGEAGEGGDPGFGGEAGEGGDPGFGGEAGEGGDPGFGGEAGGWRPRFWW